MRQMKNVNTALWFVTTSGSEGMEPLIHKLTVTFRSLLACALWTVLPVLSGQSAFAQAIQYVPVTLDIPADGGSLAAPRDLNDHGTVVAYAVLPVAKGTMFLAESPGLNTISTFNCAN